MKHKNSRLLLGAIALIGIPAYGLAQPVPGAPSWNLDTSTPTQILYNQTAIQFSDAQPGTIDGELMIPVRAFAEQTGATVHWNNDAKEVEIDLPNQAALTLMAIPEDFGSPEYGTPVPSDNDVDTPEGRSGPALEPEPLPDMMEPTQVVVIDGHAYMPLDRLATAFNGMGNWDESTGTATITVTDPPADDSVPDDAPDNN